MHRTTMKWALRAGALALTLTLPTAAQAATAPVATTGGAANVAQQTARLTGSVDPNGAATTVQFQYGTTSAYGAVTPEQVVTGDGKKTVTADITGLAPATTYHFRLIARNDKGLSKGADRSFKTKVQPLGVTFAATPNPLLTGGTTTLAGPAHGHRQRRPRRRPAEQPVPLHPGLQGRRQQARHRRGGQLLLRAADGLAQHPVPRRAPRQAGGRQPDRGRQRLGPGLDPARHQDRQARQQADLQGLGHARQRPAARRSPSRSSTPRSTG